LLADATPAKLPAAMAGEGKISVRELQRADHPRVLELNQASVQELSPLDEQRLQYILALAHRSLVAERDDREVVAFALAVAPGTDYDSRNYTTLSEMFESFLYLDRIAVADSARRQGLGAALYDAMEQAAAPFGRMVCDVNIEPRNDASLAFHAARGYREVGKLVHGDVKTVALMSKELVTL
jgi:predicted GNAT superfamily acetyltransferase